jgi:hypothetical protein
LLQIQIGAPPPNSSRAAAAVGVSLLLSPTLVDYAEMPSGARNALPDRPKLAGCNALS